jgi:hypothetical protein
MKGDSLVRKHEMAKKKNQGRKRRWEDNIKSYRRGTGYKNCAVYVQRRSLFYIHIALLDSTCFGRTGHLQMYTDAHCNVDFFPPEATTLGVKKTALQ